MKKLFAALLAGGLLAGCVTGCQSGGKEAEAYTKEQAQAILDGGIFSESLEPLDCDIAWALFSLEEAGLEREQLTDGVYYRSAGATCEELALLILDGEDAAQKAEGAVEQYLAGQIESNRDYRPAEIPKLESAVLKQSGNTVLLAVSPDSGAVEKLLEA